MQTANSSWAAVCQGEVPSARTTSSTYSKFFAMATFSQGMDMSENGQGLAAFRENKPGVHFLGTAHTLANFETAFYRSETANYDSFEQWQEEGSLDAAQRANATWKRMLRQYEAPPIDPGVDEALLDFIARRKASMPDALA